ncbi:MAG: hypothetical protein P8Y42_21510 [Exilibacterium sp.]
MVSNECKFRLKRHLFVFSTLNMCNITTISQNICPLITKARYFGKATPEFTAHSLFNQLTDDIIRHQSANQGFYTRQRYASLSQPSSFPRVPKHKLEACLFYNNAGLRCGFGETRFLNKMG